MSFLESRSCNQSLTENDGAYVMMPGNNFCYAKISLQLAGLILVWLLVVLVESLEVGPAQRICIYPHPGGVCSKLIKHQLQVLYNIESEQENFTFDMKCPMHNT